MSHMDFDCKEQGCPEKISYERQIVVGFVTTVNKETAKTVYLTCAKDHTHAYEVME